MPNHSLRQWRPQVTVRWAHACCRRPCRAAWTCKSRPQAVSVPADSSLESFTFRVTAKQAASSKLRLDTFLATQITADLATAAPRAQAAGVSRAKIQTSIAGGLVTVNGRTVAKASQQLRPGDVVVCALPPPPPMQAVPEAIPLDIKYEDDHVIVVNKPAGMVVHVAPGHYTGTLVNALLHHCALPALDLDPDLMVRQLDPSSNPNLSGEPPAGDADDDVLDDGDLHHEEDDGQDDVDTMPLGLLSGSLGGSSIGFINSSRILRPGIVHRLDKGTSGLLVVAKTEAALTRLQAQFKARTVDRVYESITVGCPPQGQGRVETNIVRDPRDRKRMAAAPYGSSRGRTAASNYTVAEPLAGGGAAFVRWKLDTGRTHQIRVHAKHLGHPLLGDATYGGTAPAVLEVVSRKFSTDTVRQCVEQLGRPALHARTLGFTHPVTGQRLSFDQHAPADFTTALQMLQAD